MNNKDLSKSLSDALVSARGARSQAEFARHLGIKHQQTYQRYEGGLVPSGLILHQIASRLGTTIDALLTKERPVVSSISVLDEVTQERARQDNKWGADRNLAAPVWHAILSEEVGECAKAILERDFSNLRDELIQVAAVAVATVENIDRMGANEMKGGRP